MAAANEVAILIRARDEASRAMGRVSKAADKMGKAVRRGAMIGAAATAAVGVASVKMAVDFETAFTEVTTLFDASEKEIGSLRKGVLGLSKEMGIDATVAAQALYQAISAGVAPGNAIDFLRENTKLAVGGVTDLTTAVDLTTTVLNAWGLAASELTRVNDTLFTTVRLGKTTVGELGESFFNVAPAAAAAGISVEEVGAALAVLTASGVRTAEATTQLRQLILALEAPTKRTGKVMEELGVKFGQGEVGAIGLDKALLRVYEATGGNIEVMRRILGSVEAVQAALVLGGEGADAFAEGLGAMEQKAGATETAFEKMNKTFGRQLALLKSELQVTMIEIGTVILPMLVTGMNKLREAVDPAKLRLKQIFQDWQPVLKETGRLVRELSVAVQDFGGWILQNQAAIVIALGAIGLALWWAMPAAAVAVTIAGIVAVIALMRADTDKLSVSMLELRRTVLETIVTFSKFAIAASAVGAIAAALTGHIFLAGGLIAAIAGAAAAADWATRELDGMAHALDSARIYAGAATPTFEGLTAALKNTSAASILVRSETGNIAYVLPRARAEANLYALSLREIARQANIAGESIETFGAKLILVAEIAAATARLQTAFVLGAPTARLMPMIQQLQALQAELEALTSIAADTGPGLGGVLGGLIEVGDAAVDAAEGVRELTRSILDMPAVTAEELLKILRYLEAADFMTVGDQLRYVQAMTDNATRALEEAARAAQAMWDSLAVGGSAFRKALAILAEAAGVTVRELEIILGLADPFIELGNAIRIVAGALGLTQEEIQTLIAGMYELEQATQAAAAAESELNQALATLASLMGVSIEALETFLGIRNALVETQDALRILAEWLGITEAQLLELLGSLATWEQAQEAVTEAVDETTRSLRDELSAVGDVISAVSDLAGITRDDLLAILDDLGIIALPTLSDALIVLIEELGLTEEQVAAVKKALEALLAQAEETTAAVQDMARSWAEIFVGLPGELQNFGMAIALIRRQQEELQRAFDAGRITLIQFQEQWAALERTLLRLQYAQEQARIVDETRAMRDEIVQAAEALQKLTDSFMSLAEAWRLGKRTLEEVVLRFAEMAGIEAGIRLLNRLQTAGELTVTEFERLLDILMDIGGLQRMLAELAVPTGVRAPLPPLGELLRPEGMIGPAANITQEITNYITIKSDSPAEIAHMMEMIAIEQARRLAAEGV